MGFLWSVRDGPPTEPCAWARNSLTASTCSYNPRVTSRSKPSFRDAGFIKEPSAHLMRFGDELL